MLHAANDPLALPNAVVDKKARTSMGCSPNGKAVVMHRQSKPSIAVKTFPCRFHAAPAWRAVCLVGLELAVNQFDRNGAADGLRCCRATEFLPRQAQMEAYRAFRNSQHCSNLLWESSLCYQIDALKLSGG